MTAGLVLLLASIFIEHVSWNTHPVCPQENTALVVGRGCFAVPPNATFTTPDDVSDVSESVQRAGKLMWSFANVFCIPLEGAFIWNST